MLFKSISYNTIIQMLCKFLAMTNNNKQNSIIGQFQKYISALKKLNSYVQNLTLLQLLPTAMPCSSFLFYDTEYLLPNA